MQSQHKNTIPDRVYNIKGLSWMLSAKTATSAISSNNSSQIDQQFKIFKLKDQKKKWKKKINKKFESVAHQIQTNIKNKYIDKQTFDLSRQSKTSYNHTPHLRQSKSLFLQSSINKQKMQIKELCSFAEQKKNFENDMKKQNFLTQNKENFELSEKDASKQNEIFRLKKAFAERRSEKQKVMKSKNILRIHSKQKQFIQKSNQKFFGKELQWVNDKVDFYNQFNIQQYEKQLIQKRSLQK